MGVPQLDLAAPLSRRTSQSSKADIHTRQPTKSKKKINQKKDNDETRLLRERRQQPAIVSARLPSDPSIQRLAVRPLVRGFDGLPPRPLPVGPDDPPNEPFVLRPEASHRLLELLRVPLDAQTIGLGKPDDVEEGIAHVSGELAVDHLGE